MTSKILSVSNLNSSFVSDDNAEILSTFNPPLSLNIDTQFNFKSGFIDVVGLGNSGQDIFIIDKAITANITVSYYEQLCAINTDATNGQYLFNEATETIINNDVDGGLLFKNLHYVLYVFTLKPGRTQSHPRFATITDYENIEIVKEVININIIPGTYSSDSIVEYLNIELQGLNRGISNFLLTGLGEPVAAVPNINATNANIGLRSYLPWEELVKKYTKYVKNAQFPNGAYTQYLGFLNIDSGSNQIELKTNGLNYYYKQEIGQGSSNTFAKLMIGTSLLSLQNIDDLLSFSYTHNPLFGGNPREQIIQLEAIQKSLALQLVYNWRMRRGGINIIDLEPKEFWFDILGFDDSILLNIKTVTTPTNIDLINIVGLNSFETSTTKPFIGSADYDQNFANDESTVYPVDSANKQFPGISVQTTIPLKAVNAINYSDLNNGGHFLLSFEIGQKVNNFISNDVTQNIISIMSREYLNDGFISVFDGGNPLVLTANTVISYIKVNIIDPLTGKNAVNLGNRNTFYFELG